MFKFAFRQQWLKRRPKPVTTTTLAVLGGVILIGLLVYGLWLAPPSGNESTMVRIESGSSLKNITQTLATEGVIKSPVAVEWLIRLAGNSQSVIAGDYLFIEPLSAWQAAWRLGQGEYGLDLTRVTLPEGLTAAQKADIISRRLPHIDRDKLAALGRKHEGWLFPDTYFFSPLDDEEAIIQVMLDNFNQRIEPLESEIAASGRSLEDIVIMASLLELEARTTESRRMIAGILWKRLDNNMLLQVDAVFPYIIGKNTFQVTLRDLQYDSPYNTYRYLGLPAGAIASPGLDSIKAALRPIDSPFWYYLSDMQGNMHYTITHDDHVRNKQRYLR